MARKEPKLAPSRLGTYTGSGFPSPADDFTDLQLSLDEHLITHPATTFLAYAKGDAMQGVGIYDGDILIIDRSLPWAHGAVIVAAIDGEMICRILDWHRRLLVAAKPQLAPISFAGREEATLEGIVSYSIRRHLPR